MHKILQHINIVLRLSNHLFFHGPLLDGIKLLIESATRGVLCWKVFSEISQNLRENTCARVSYLIKLLNFIKKETLVLVFPVNFVKFIRAPFFTEHLWTSASVGVILSRCRYYEINLVMIKRMRYVMWNRNL